MPLGEFGKTRYSPFPSELAAFEKHKKELLDGLRKVHEGRPKSEPFDEYSAWLDLKGAANWYFQRLKQKPMLPGRRVERLGDLAKTVGRAHDVVQKAMQDDVGHDLLRGWYDDADITPGSDPMDGLTNTTRFIDGIRGVLANLATLKAVASKAIRDVPRRAGAPRGTGILSLHDIQALQHVYRRNTGQLPILGHGPFAEFVQDFLTAVGRADDTSQDYVVEALKYARKRRKKHAK